MTKHAFFERRLLAIDLTPFAPDLGVVYAQTLRADEFFAVLEDGDEWDRKSQSNRLIEACIVTAEGQPLFDAGEASQIITALWTRLLDAANEANSLSDEAVALTKKNSSSAPSA